MKYLKINIKTLKFLPIILFAICMLNSCLYIKDKKITTETNTPIPTPSTTALFPSDVPKNIDDKESSPNKDPKYTSQELINFVKDCITQEKEDELFNFSAGKELDINSLLSLKISDEGRDYLNNVYDGNGSITLIDIDNDKTDDIITYEHSGGSDGFVYFAKLKMNESGVFEFSEYPNFLTIDSKYNYIRYNDKNYYIDEEWDYYKDILEGVNIYAFDKGMLVEHVYVTKYSDSIQLTTEYISENTYNDLLKKISEDAKNAFESLNISDIYFGNIEKSLSENNRKILENDGGYEDIDWKEVDLDNDALPELVCKEFEYFNKSRCFSYLIKEEENNKFVTIDLLKKYNIELDNDNLNVQQLWFEEFNSKVYLISLSQEIEKNIYQIKAFLLNNSSAQEILDIKAEYIKQAGVKV